MKRCPDCNAEYPEDKKFCVLDGKPLVGARKPPAPAPPPSGATLTILSPDGGVRTFDIGTATVHIGKDQSSTIVLLDPMVSRRHAAIQFRAGRHAIFDEGSRNGVIVNGQPVRADGWVLNSGDVAILGQTRITYQSAVQHRPAPANDHEEDARVMKRPESLKREWTRLQVHFAAGESTSVPLVGSPFVIGRDPSSNLVLADPTVSRRQAVLSLQDGTWHVANEGQAPVLVNGRVIGPHGFFLRNGDTIQIGANRIAFQQVSAVEMTIEEVVEKPLVPPKPAPPKPAPPPPPPPMAPPTELATNVVRPANRPIPPAAPPEQVPQPAVRVSASGELDRAPGQAPLVLDGRYEVRERIGSDATGTLYRARRLLLGDEVAVRVLRPEFVSDNNAIERFRRQALVAARIHHPNSVQVYDFGYAKGGAVYIVEELLSGRTLRDLVRQERGLTLSRIVGIFNQICGAVHTAHMNGIVLRDLKPDTIFVEQGVDGNEIIKVGGYSLAKLDAASSGGVTMAGQAKLFGSPQYMSPEQWLDKPLDSRSDVYSLGVILFELLTGSVPYDGREPFKIAEMHLFAPVPNAADVGRREIDEDIAGVVARALSKDPSQRPPTALHLARELEAVSGGPGRIARVLINKATRHQAASPIVVPPMAPAEAGAPVLPSVVAEPEQKGGGALNGVVVALMVEAFLSKVSGGLNKTIVPLFALLVFGFDITEVMLLVLVQSIVPLVLRPWFGTLADNYGKKRIFLVSLSIRTIVSILYAVAVAPWFFFLISAIRGVADSAKGPSVSAMIADNTDERNIATAYSWYTTVKTTSGGIGESFAAFALIGLLMLIAGQWTTTVNVAILDQVNTRGEQVEEIISGPDAVSPDGTLPGTEANPQPRTVLSVEQREMSLSQVPIDDLPKVVDMTALRRSIVAIFILSTIFSALSVLLVVFFLKEKAKVKDVKKKASDGSKGEAVGEPAERRPNVWAFAVLGTALTAPAYMVTGEFFTVLAVKLEVTPNALGWIKLIAETLTPLVFGPVFGWLADRIGAGKVIVLRSVANMVTSLLFWITPWFVGTFLLATMMGVARGVDEIGKAAFKPTWGAVAAKVSSFDLGRRSRTMGIMEGGVDASELVFPVLAGVLLQYLSLGWLMLFRAVLALVAEIYAIILTRLYRI